LSESQGPVSGADLYESWEDLMSSENGKTIFEEAAAERELEELRRAIEETRARRRRANAAFDEFLKGFDQKNRAAVPAPQPAGPPPRERELPDAEPYGMPQDDGLAAFAPASPAAPGTLPAPVDQSPLDDFAQEGPSTASAPLRSIPAALAPARSSQVRRAAPIVAIAVVGILAVFLWSRARSQDGAAAPVAVAAPPAPAVPAPAPPAAATSGTEPPPPAEITTIRRVWMRVTVDGERVVEREVAEGTKIPLKGSQIVILAGDAGAVKVSIAGKDQGVFGPAGQAATRTFTVKP
jgi:RodZ C-terminal domain